MAMRKILPIAHPLLRHKAKSVRQFDPALRQLVADLFETLQGAEGAGLAGPQIGQSLQVFVATYEEQRLALCNPEIVKATGEERGTEGCLSMPGYVGENIRRATQIVVKGQDVRGKWLRIPAEGWFARILQHEIDHLNGILFLDRLERPDDLRAIRPEERGAGTAVAS